MVLFRHAFDLPSVPRRAVCSSTNSLRRSVSACARSSECRIAARPAHHKRASNRAISTRLCSATPNAVSYQPMRSPASRMAPVTTGTTNTNGSRRRVAIPAEPVSPNTLMGPLSTLSAIATASASPSASRPCL